MGTDSPTSASSWRSSTLLVIFTATLGLFTENFLYGFVIPIMAYMFEVRLGQDPAYTQRYASGMLFIMGFICVFAAPVIGHFADQTPSRRIPLLISLVGCTAGTALVAATPNVYVVFIGRVIQGAAGTGAWIVSFAMLTDSIDKKHFGKTLGFASSFVTAGVLTGPAVSGALLEWLGYWPAWSVPFALLAIDLVARLLVVEVKKPQKSSAADQRNPNGEEVGESTGLLAAAESSANDDDDDEAPKQDHTTTTTSPPSKKSSAFYTIMLTNPSILAALANIITFSLIVAAFDATFPLHLRQAFHWGPAAVGSIFLGIQIPAMLLAPLIGWLRDRVGLRWPTALGWLLMAPVMWFLGVPGGSKLPGIDSDARGEAAFVAGIIALGLVSPLTRGSGGYQMVATLRDLEASDPALFGPHGGSTRLFSLTEVAFSGGLMLGPIVGGFLSDTVGFYYMMCVLAVMCLAVSITSAMFLTTTTKGRNRSGEV
ncbi:MFS general substrate transporter [Lecanosticta acicola]|uniref:MFS general substrate transporter n=1 Tax=Lecanosticta acicola TaxID=111012 RepID=A0AAI8YTY0_9PEZI|nr:MFS general substrate transporter [Lecanosticta acicola]